MNQIIKIHLERMIKNIFEKHDITRLTTFQKRKKIFEHLTKFLSYDERLYKKIRINQQNSRSLERDLKSELYNVILNKTGICNSISQYYKLLLEQVGIQSLCVICDNQDVVAHQITLVYDDNIDSYSFDDVTCAILHKDRQKDYFNYDVLKANANGQGNKVLFDDIRFVVVPDEMIDYFVEREIQQGECIVNIPKNIASVNEDIKKEPEMIR